MIDTAYDRLLKASMLAFEVGVERLIEREFDILRALPNDVAEVPFIDSVPYTNEQFNPHAPPEELVALKALVAQALRARRWFEYEAPPWAQPLTLKAEECSRLMNIRDVDVSQHVRRRSALMGRYGQTMRTYRWEYSRMLPFEMYCRQWL